MEDDPPNVPLEDDSGIPSRTASPHRPASLTTSTSNATVSSLKSITTLQDEKDQRSSLSHNSSPRITSILLPPSEGGGSRPRSPGEGRITSLNIPRVPSRASRHTSGSFRRRGNASITSRSEMMDDTTEAEGFLNFGLGEDFSIIQDDAQVLQDVQRVLRSKAKRDATRDKGSTSEISTRPPASPNVHSAVDVSSIIQQSKASLGKSQKAFPSLSTQTDLATGSDTLYKFPSTTLSASRSVESLSSAEPGGRSALPVLLSRPDGTDYLDWSGQTESLDPKRGRKDRSIIGRTLSLTKPKVKPKTHIRKFSARNSLDLRASQGDFHAAMLDSIRRSSKRETIIRAEITKDELFRRYAYLDMKLPPGDPPHNFLQLVKSRPSSTPISTPWLSWCRSSKLPSFSNTSWFITGEAIEESMHTAGQSPYGMPLPSPTATSQGGYGFPSPISSPRSSFSSPVGPDGNPRMTRKQLELTHSLSANHLGEPIIVKHPPTPVTARARSFSNAMATLDKNPSADALMVPDQLNNVPTSPRSSVDMGSDRQSFATPPKAEKESSLRKRFRRSFGGGDMTAINESKVATTLSTGSLRSSNGHGSSSRLHLSVGTMLGKILKSGDENDSKKEYARSSLSAEDSGREGNARSDGVASLTSDRLSPLPRRRLPGLMASLRDGAHTSDSEHSNGPETARLGGRFVKRGHSENLLRVVAEKQPGSFSGGDGWSTNGPKTSTLPSRRTRQGRISISPTPHEMGRESFQDMLRKLEEEEDRSKEMYKTRELLLVEANDHNRKIARLLKAVSSSVREFEAVQREFSKVLSINHRPIPQEVLDAVNADPATNLRHGKGWRAVEDSHERFSRQQNLLTSYVALVEKDPPVYPIPSLRPAITTATELWEILEAKRKRLDQLGWEIVAPALAQITSYLAELQREYNEIQMMVETDYPEQSRITDLVTIILESSAPQGWLEFAAVWLPEHVLEFIGGFIRFFGVPISEKFIRPLLWYFFRNRYYWKIYSGEPPPSERAWYTRLAYWVLILSLLAWYTTADAVRTS